MNIGRLLALGGLGALVSNLLFPRVADPWDTASVLTMMAENVGRRQMAFVGVTVSIWLIAGSLIELALRGSSPVGRWGAGLIGLGTAAFTVASALGLAATGPARNGFATEGGASTDLVVATVLNRADDFVWFLSIVALWAGIGLVGIALHRGAFRVAGAVLTAIGFGAAFGVGLPLVAGVESQSLLIAFGVFASATAAWCLVVGASLARRPAAS